MAIRDDTGQLGECLTKDVNTKKLEAHIVHLALKGIILLVSHHCVYLMNLHMKVVRKQPRAP